MGRNTSARIQPAHVGEHVSTVSFLWRTMFLPIMGFAYLIFCYVCHHRLVEVRTGMDLGSHLQLVKAGVTSINIIFVTISLLPLATLLSDLKSEEFFRALADKRQGIRLSSLNNVSTPSRGIWDSLVVLTLQQGSRYFAGTFLAGLIFLAASTLAPAALSVDTVLFDGDLVALPVGAVKSNTVMSLGNFSAPSAMDLSKVVEAKGPEMGSLAWAEVTLGVNYSFSSPVADPMAYVVPTPVNLTTNTTASWLSDVVVMRPQCEWVAPHILSNPVNLSDFSISAPGIVMNLEEKQVQVQVSVGGLAFSETQAFSLKSNWSQSGLSEMRRFDTHDDLTDGTSVWMFLQCVSGCKSLGTPLNVTVGPDFRASPLSATDGQIRNVSLLYCTPNAQIQAHRVHNDGTGFMAVGDAVPVRQGNLHAAQTKLLLSYIFKEFEDVGPPKGSTNHLGKSAQLSLLFGNNVNVTGTEVSLSSIDTITKYYGRFLQSGMKKFLDGSLASAYVPSRATRKITVFSPSMPHVIVSTVLYFILSVFVIVCYFRRPFPQFTLSTVATALDKSNIPPLFEHFTQSTPGSYAEAYAMASLGSARVISEEAPDGSRILKLRKSIEGGAEKL